MSQSMMMLWVFGGMMFLATAVLTFQFAHGAKQPRKYIAILWSILSVIYGILWYWGGLHYKMMAICIIITSLFTLLTFRSNPADYSKGFYLPATPTLKQSIVSLIVMLVIILPFNYV